MIKSRAIMKVALVYDRVNKIGGAEKEFSWLFMKFFPRLLYIPQYTIPKLRLGQKPLRSYLHSCKKYLLLKLTMNYFLG
jgi:hypothetical protein